MIICVCQGVSHKSIDQAIENGAASASRVAQQLGIGGCCGKCIPVVKERLAEKKAAGVVRYVA